MRALLVAAAVLPLAACVERSLMIRTKPSGAAIFVDGDYAGKTPVRVPFLYYGTREIVVELRGFRSLRVLREIDAPFYQYPGIDFLTDVVLPTTIRDHRWLLFELTPLGAEPDREQILQRAREMRTGARSP